MNTIKAILITLLILAVCMSLPFIVAILSILIPWSLLAIAVFYIVKHWDDFT
jgi:hypothetical protein